MDRRVEVEQVQQMIQLARRHGLQAGTFIMVGYPGETKEDIYATLQHLKKADPDLYTITVAYPIKGTPLYTEVESRFVTQPDWATSTDRDIDFERTYNREYYNYAIQLIHSEVTYYKALKKPVQNLFKLPMLKLRSIIAKRRMQREEGRHNGQ